MDISGQKCCVKKFGGFGYADKSCKNAAKVERDGKFYCGVHNPARRETRSAEWSAKRKREREEIRLADQHKQLLADAGIDTLTTGDLAKIIAAGGIRKVAAEVLEGSR